MSTPNALAHVTVIAICLAALAAPAAADTHTWVGAGDGTSWHDPANWSPAELPLATSTGDDGDDVVIDGAYDVVVDATVASVHSIAIDGDATLTIASGLTLKTNNLDIVDGGLILEELDDTGAYLGWGKANRGHLYVEAAGYIAGAGTIRTTTGGGGLQIRSQRAADFDMTGITLQLAYGENLLVASADLGRDNLPAWNPENFAFGTLQFADRRFSHTLNGTPNTHALYCRTLRFSGSSGDIADMDLNGLNVYVLDKIVWGNGTVVDTPGELTVAAAHDDDDPTTSLWDDSDEPGQAFVGQGVSPNDPPVADAGPDQTVIDADGDGFQLVALDGTGSFARDTTIIKYIWSIGETMLSLDAATTMVLPVGQYTLTLTVTDSDGAEAADDVVITVRPASASTPGDADTDGDVDLDDFVILKQNFGRIGDATWGDGDFDDDGDVDLDDFVLLKTNFGT